MVMTDRLPFMQPVVHTTATYQDGKTNSTPISQAVSLCTRHPPPTLGLPPSDTPPPPPSIGDSADTALDHSSGFHPAVAVECTVGSTQNAV